MPADARREPLPDAGHGPGRPPDGPPGEEPWGFARGFRSLFQWPQQNAAPPLPPLTASGLRGLHEDGDQDGGVHRPAVTSPGLTQANVRVPGASGDVPEPTGGHHSITDTRLVRVVNRSMFGLLYYLDRAQESKYSFYQVCLESIAQTASYSRLQSLWYRSACYMRSAVQPATRIRS